jgi:Transglycosylase SLT domain
MGRFLRRRGSWIKPGRRRVVAVVAVAALAALGALDIFVTTQVRDPAQANVRTTGSRTSPSSARPSASASSQPAGPVKAASTFGQIILPDLLIMLPGGLTAGQIARLQSVPGVRDMITFDGAKITVGGRPVNAIGVDPDTFRPWAPLATASDQSFWAELAGGDFMAASPAQNSLGLMMGGSYQLAGAGKQIVRYGKAAELGLAEVDVLVNPKLSARLGLVRKVAGLISAPGVGIATLQSEVASILGPSGQIVALRRQQQSSPTSAPPTAAAEATGGRPTSYLELFRASAAQYCPGLSWTVLAAIAQIESADGQNNGPSSAGALGPMQFLPSTWSTWGIDAFGETGPPDVMNPYDAVPSAARLLCADGGAAGGAALSAAIYDYNHANWYVSEVLALSAAYAAAYPS